MGKENEMEKENKARKEEGGKGKKEEQKEDIAFTKQQFIVFSLFWIFLILGSIGFFKIILKLILSPQTQKIVMVDVTKITRGFILRESRLDLTEEDLKLRSREYLKNLDELLARIAKDNKVVIFPKQAILSKQVVLAGAEDITDQVSFLMKSRIPCASGAGIVNSKEFFSQKSLEENLERRSKK